MLQLMPSFVVPDAPACIFAQLIGDVMPIIKAAPKIVPYKITAVRNFLLLLYISNLVSIFLWLIYAAP
jgi:hypothetical protein